MEHYITSVLQKNFADTDFIISKGELFLPQGELRLPKSTTEPSVTTKLVDQSKIIENEETILNFLDVMLFVVQNPTELAVKINEEAELEKEIGKEELTMEQLEDLKTALHSIWFFILTLDSKESETSTDLKNFNVKKRKEIDPNEKDLNEKKAVRRIKQRNIQQKEQPEMNMEFLQNFIKLPAEIRHLILNLIKSTSTSVGITFRYVVIRYMWLNNLKDQIGNLQKDFRRLENHWTYTNMQTEIYDLNNPQPFETVELIFDMRWDKLSSKDLTNALKRNPQIFDVWLMRILKYTNQIQLTSETRPITDNAKKNMHFLFRLLFEIWLTNAGIVTLKQQIDQHGSMEPLRIQNYEPLYWQPNNLRQRLVHHFNIENVGERFKSISVIMEEQEFDEILVSVLKACLKTANKLSGHPIALRRSELGDPEDTKGHFIYGIYPLSFIHNILSKEQQIFELVIENRHPHFDGFVNWKLLKDVFSRTTAVKLTNIYLQETFRDMAPPACKYLHFKYTRLAESKKKSEEPSFRYVPAMSQQITIVGPEPITTKKSEEKMRFKFEFEIQLEVNLPEIMSFENLNMQIYRIQNTITESQAKNGKRLYFTRCKIAGLSDDSFSNSYAFFKLFQHLTLAFCSIHKQTLNNIVNLRPAEQGYVTEIIMNEQ
jgi:hypothetical protein